jgi:hypothetical protein
MSLRDRIQALKDQPEFAAAGSKWTQDDDARVIEMISGGRTISEVAAECKRTQGSIRARVLLLGLRMVDQDEMPSDEVCALLRLHPADIDAERARQKAKWDAARALPPQRSHEKETFTDVLKDIRSILRRIEQRL